jgi:AraC-like DNA-binding protein
MTNVRMDMSDGQLTSTCPNVSNQERVDYRIRQLLALVNREIHRPFGVEQLASAAGLSPTGLRVLFIRDLGVPPYRFIKRLRLERARYLLCSQPLTVKETMNAVGLSDESHFVREFERAYGLSPKRYRQRFFGQAPAPCVHRADGQQIVESANEFSL